MSEREVIAALRILLKELLPKEPISILEVCTGPSIYAPFANPSGESMIVNHEKHVYYKVDVERSIFHLNYKVMRKKFPGYMPIIGDYESLPLRNKCIDVVTIENYPHTRKSIKESIRVIRKGGFFISLRYPPEGEDYPKGILPQKGTMKLITSKNEEFLEKWDIKVKIYQKV